MLFGCHSIQKGAQVVQKSPAVTKPQSKKVTKESSSEESSEEDEPVKPVSKPASKVSTGQIALNDVPMSLSKLLI